LPEADRLARLAPVADGRAFVRADYGQIEPRIILAILRRRGLISWEAGTDLYRDLAGEAADRDAAKTAVNAVINGGRPPAGATGRLAEFVEAAAVYRTSLAAEAKRRGYVETLAGRPIELSADEPNHRGKAVNRVVQGTAADIFNRAAVAITAALAASGLPADVAFLLFDELWVESTPEALTYVADLVRSEMTAVALGLGVFVPVKIDPPPEIPGIDARGEFDPETYARSLADDPHAAAERDAIQAESGPGVAP
jgi:DNA polymerase-1